MLHATLFPTVVCYILFSIIGSECMRLLCKLKWNSRFEILFVYDSMRFFGTITSFRLRAREFTSVSLSTFNCLYSGGLTSTVLPLLKCDFRFFPSRVFFFFGQQLFKGQYFLPKLSRFSLTTHEGSQLYRGNIRRDQKYFYQLDSFLVNNSRYLTMYLCIGCIYYDIDVDVPAYHNEVLCLKYIYIQLLIYLNAPFNLASCL